jgi:hypothetical protein
MKPPGIRVVIGGDYGFARTPHGENVRDIAHFVNHLGYSPGEALVCATRYGAALMGISAGQVREGFLADLLLVDGDPVAAVKIRRNRDRPGRSSKAGRPTSWTVPVFDRGNRVRRNRCCYTGHPAPPPRLRAHSPANPARGISRR